MKTFLYLICLILPSSAREIVADIAAVLDKPPSAAQEAFGKPSSKTARTSNWEEGDWLWNLNFEKGKCVQACLPFIPKGTTYADMPDLVTAFGFTKEKGWTVGPRQATARLLDSFSLIHKDRGTFLLKATHGDKPGTWSVLNFFAPGHSKPPKP